MTSPDFLADATRLFTQMGGSFLRPGAIGSTGAADAVLLQAHLAATGSLARAGQRGSESWLNYGREAAAKDDAGIRLDAARAHLRRLAEIAAEEAQLLARQLQALDEQLCRAAEAAAAPAAAPAAAAGGEDDPVRRARAKP